MLPTILFIIAAYALYALVMVWCRWQHSRFSGKRGKIRSRWLTLAGGAGVLGLFLWLILCLAPSGTDQKVRLAGILGVSEGEALLAGKAIARTAPPELNQKSLDGQPAYALLHPESPPSLLPPDKPPAGTKLSKSPEKPSSVRMPLKSLAKPKLNKTTRAPNKVKVAKKTKK